ncbi:MAG: peptidoglycan DD-metalloendopeptidase family protein [Muribaculaceae bacterium]|nr:peptidoglycan DD-metalloendopeptidase family protein [Muribaculaceae bacterium]
MNRLFAIIIIIISLVVAVPADGAKKKTGKKAQTTQTTKKKTTKKSSTNKKPAATSSKNNTSSSVKQRQKETNKAIQETSRKIEENERELMRRLDRLNEIGGDMVVLDKSIAATRTQLDTLDNHIQQLTDTISKLDDRMSLMRTKYASAIRRIVAKNRLSTSDLAYIFSSTSVAQAYRRARLLDKYRVWRKHKSEELAEIKQHLDSQRVKLEEITLQHQSSLDKLNTSLADLNSKKMENDKIVSSLKREEGRLKKVLKQRQAEATALEAELQRLIAQEQERMRRDEEQRRKNEQIKKSDKGTTADNGGQNVSGKTVKPKKNSGEAEQIASSEIKIIGDNFAANKGRIPFPVTCKYKIVKHFGRQKHPDLMYVETDNAGIDIETSKEAPVRAVFDGRVSDIFRLPGYNMNVIMIRHGNYITIYANLGKINVKKGDNVKAGQTIGNVLSDPDNDGRSILHFEIRNEKAKENPELWLS